MKTFLQRKRKVSWLFYNKLRNIWVCILWNSKRSHYTELDIKTLNDYKNFWKALNPLFPDKDFFIPILFKIFIQISHIITKNFQSAGTKSFSVPGNQPAQEYFEYYFEQSKSFYKII